MATKADTESKSKRFRRRKISNENHSMTNGIGTRNIASQDSQNVTVRSNYGRSTNPYGLQLKTNTATRWSTQTPASHQPPRLIPLLVEVRKVREHERISNNTRLSHFVLMPSHGYRLVQSVSTTMGKSKNLHIMPPWKAQMLRAPLIVTSKIHFAPPVSDIIDRVQSIVRKLE